MEIILWSCVEAQKLINNVRISKVPNNVKEELVQIYIEHSPKTCTFMKSYMYDFTIDAKAD